MLIMLPQYGAVFHVDSFFNNLFVICFFYHFSLYMEVLLSHKYTFVTSFFSPCFIVISISNLCLLSLMFLQYFYFGSSGFFSCYLFSIYSFRCFCYFWLILVCNKVHFPFAILSFRFIFISVSNLCLISLLLLKFYSFATFTSFFFNYSFTPFFFRWL